MEKSWQNLLSSLEMHEEMDHQELQCPTNYLDDDQLVQEETNIAGGNNRNRKRNRNRCSYDSQNHVASSPATYILSFDKSTIHEDPYHCFDFNNNNDKATFGDVSAATHSVPSSSTNNNLGAKKSRSSSETLYHIMTERKRRQTITEKFIALSATIPGLKKMNKASVLEEAINYVKQLQSRVRELEEETAKSSVDSLIVLRKSHLYIDEETTACRESKCGTGDCCFRMNETLPEIEARVLKKEVLIRIHCGKQEGVLLKILSQLEKHHLTAPKSCVLPFANTLGITIVAQMGENYRMIAKDLVKNLKLALR